MDKLSVLNKYIRGKFVFTSDFYQRCHLQFFKAIFFNKYSTTIVIIHFGAVNFCKLKTKNYQNSTTLKLGPHLHHRIAQTHKTFS